MRALGTIAIVGGLAWASPPLAARALPTQSQKVLQPLLSCRQQTDPTARLACYDKAADALNAAAEDRSIVVVDKAEVQKARRSLFGFSVPSLKLFGDDEDEKRPHQAAEPEQDQITATIRSARQDADGMWIVTLEDGATWKQTGGTIALRPKPGQTVTIKKAALGSYFLRIGNASGVKARRVG